VNLTLPFDEVALDEYLARIDRELDTLFLEAVAEAVEQRRAEPAEDGATAAA
jgi:hypothetical protein